MTPSALASSLFAERTMQGKPGRAGAAIILLMATFCANAGDWGLHAMFAPGWARLRQSAVNAARDPMTWIPAAAAVAVFASGQDEEWARDLHDSAPVFGSARKADEQSDRYRLAAEVLWKTSMLAADSGEPMLHNKAKGIATQVMAVNATYWVSNDLKRHVDRAEPGAAHGKAEGDAFPSNHATSAFAHAALIRRNMRASRLPEPVAVGVVATGYVAASGAAWGRVEAGAHHLSDQLMGAALGNFVATFINDAFMGEETLLSLGCAPSGDWSVGIAVKF